MTQPLHTVGELVERGLADVPALIHTVRGHESEPRIRALAEFGIDAGWASCHTESALTDLISYRDAVGEPFGAGWMDNTTLVTAAALLSGEGPDFMTPLTVWDLAAFARAVVCLESVYHHEHPDVDDNAINEHLGEGVVRSIYLPRKRGPGGGILPDPWEGAHRYMCELYDEALSWLRRLHEAANSGSLDSQQLDEVTSAWRIALDDEELSPFHLVAYKEVDHSWTSPSNMLLEQLADATSLSSITTMLDPSEAQLALTAQRRELNLPDPFADMRPALLSSLNLRAYVNQRLADFFGLPYNSSLARLPFRRHLYDRAIEVQHQLQSADVIDNRYGEIARGARLRLPVFLAVALRNCHQPEDLWSRLAELRRQSAPFRKNRTKLDHALAAGDLVEASKLAKALNASLENVVLAAGKAVSQVGLAVVEQAAKGDVSAVGLGVAAVKAAKDGALEPSFAQRILWRFRRPELVWAGDFSQEAKHLTESLSELARIWSIPANRQGAFARRFQRVSALAAPA